MGFFSWKTNDTNRSIANAFSNRDTFTVHMIDDKGNVWTEHNYEGYGEFGGKDYYELLAEMNGRIEGCGRDAGISLAFDADERDTKYPMLVEDKEHKWDNVEPESCNAQGYFYGEDDEEDEDDW